MGKAEKKKQEMVSEDQEKALRAAVAEYLDRKAGRSMPAGKWDRRKCWYPSDAERRECCDAIRLPSRTWPYGLRDHARTAEHVAALHGVDPAALRRAARQASQTTTEADHHG